MARYLTELLGTFFLVFSVGFAVLSGNPAAPLAIGGTLMVMVYMGGHVSGGHYNPAVSLGVFLRGKLSSGDLVPYWVAQIGGATLAALAVRIIGGATFAPAPAPDAGVVAVLLSEVLVTFALVLMVLNVATHPATEGNSYYGLAIGGTVTVGAYAVGGVSGGAFNPAVGIGPIVVNALAGGGTWANLWFYLVGPLAGAFLAAAVFRIQLPRDAEG